MFAPLCVHACTNMLTSSCKASNLFADGLFQPDILGLQGEYGEGATQGPQNTQGASVYLGKRQHRCKPCLMNEDVVRDLWGSSAPCTDAGGPREWAEFQSHTDAVT